MREVWLSDDAPRLFAVEAGEGPAFVFLHGGLTDHRAVLPLVRPLADRCRVVTPDLRASGRSLSSEPLTFEQLSADLLRLLNHLEVPSAFVGGISSRFIASGAQPFGSTRELGAINGPTLLIRGNDHIHPASVSALYAYLAELAQMSEADFADSERMTELNEKYDLVEIGPTPA